MATTTKVVNGEYHHYALEPSVKRGDFYGGLSSDGKQIIVHWGSPLGYPTGSSVFRFNKEDIPTIIACLTASLNLKE